MSLSPLQVNPILRPMRAADFDFDLPPELVAQRPAAERDASRLLVVRRGSVKFEHRVFKNLVDFLNPGDLLVLNNSKVIPARLHGNNAETHGQFELFLIEEVAVNEWWAMLKPGKRAREGTRILLRDKQGSATGIEATVVEKNEEGHGRLEFRGVPNIREKLDELGEVPLPPYIERSESSKSEEDRERYQTVFAEKAGSVAAPTAGLHFTEDLLGQLRQHGVQVCFVTLHVGLGTFAPVKSEELSGHTMHEENYEVTPGTARLINDAKTKGNRVMAVGTTSLRVLESVAAQAGDL